MGAACPASRETGMGLPAGYLPENHCAFWLSSQEKSAVSGTEA